MSSAVADRRIGEVDILRGTAAVLMVLGHSFIRYPVDISADPVCVALGHFIYTFHMELFFVLAGFVYKCRSYKQFIAKKVRHLLVPYLLFGSVFAVLHAYGGAAINGVEPLSDGIFKLIFTGGGYWFLYVSFAIFLVFPFLERICPSVAGQACMALLCLIVSQFFELPSLFGVSAVTAYLPYFITGYCAARINGKEITEQVRSKKVQRILIWVIPIIVFCALDAFEVFLGYELGAVGRYIRAMAVIVVLSCLACVCNAVFRQNHVWAALRGLFEDCSRYSLQIYLFNGYLMTILRIVICQLLHITVPFVIVLGIWIGDLFITLVLCKYICRKVPIFSFLCGIQ